MRFKVISVAILSVFCFSVSAQESADPQKETVIVDKFARTTAVPSYIAEGIRANVMEGFVKKGRFHVVDAETNDALKRLSETRQAEDNVNSANVMGGESEAVYKSLGAKYLVKANVTDRTVSREKSILTGNMDWCSRISFSLTVYNIIDGSTMASKNIQLTGIDSSSDQKADMSAVENAAKEMRSFVDNYFKFETTIEQIEEADAKKGAKVLYVVGGSELGVKKGQQFVVYVEKKIGSRTTKQEVGGLKACEVLDGITKCNVSKGGVEINEAFNAGTKLIVVSAGNAKEKAASFFGF